MSSGLWGLSLWGHLSFSDSAQASLQPGGWSGRGSISWGQAPMYQCWSSLCSIILVAVSSIGQSNSHSQVQSQRGRDHTRAWQSRPHLPSFLNMFLSHTLVVLVDWLTLSWSTTCIAYWLEAKCPGVTGNKILASRTKYFTWEPKRYVFGKIWAFHLCNLCTS